MGSTRYIMSMGELTRKDNSLCFRKRWKKCVYSSRKYKRNLLSQRSEY